VDRHNRVSISKTVRTALVLSGAALLLPSLAEAQSHGTLQVSATVVDSKAGIQTLAVARTAISHWSNAKTERHVDVTTLAQVSVALDPAIHDPANQPAERQAPATTLVVRIDYVNN